MGKREVPGIDSAPPLVKSAMDAASIDINENGRGRIGRWSRLRKAVKERDVSEMSWRLMEIALNDLRDKGFVDIEGVALKDLVKLVATCDAGVTGATTAAETAKAIEEKKKIKAWLRAV